MKGKKTGGRQKGTPNKPSPLKELLYGHSLKYYTPRTQTNADGTPRTLEYTRDGERASVVLQDADGSPLVMSDFEVDMMLMDVKDRAALEERLLRYHTPQMQSVAAEVSLSGDISMTMEERLARLAAGTDG